MAIWFILLVMKPEKEHEAYLELVRTIDIEYVYPLFGEWDILVKIVGVEDELRNIVEQIGRIDGVLTVKTLIGL